MDSVSERMSADEVTRWLSLADDELQVAADNLELGHLRVVVSRAYYAMFYAATAALGHEGLWRNTHQGVISAFGERFVKPGYVEPEYGRLLHSAFSARLRGDYEPGVAFDEAYIRELIDDATDFVARVRRMLHEAT